MRSPIVGVCPIVWLVTPSDDPAALPDFISRIDTGMGTLDDEHVTESAGSRLTAAEAKDLGERLRAIADARLRARAASRQAFIR